LEIIDTDPLPILLVSFNSLSPGIWIQLLLIACLLILSAVFSASEVAYFSLSPTELDKIRTEKSSVNLRILDILSKPKRLLATILIANNTVNVAIAIMSTTIVDGMMVFDEKEWLLRFLIQVIGVTLLILIVGEITPKVFATANAVRVASVMSTPIILIRKLLYPISSILVKSNNLIDKKFKKRNNNITVNELGHALELTYSSENTTVEEKKILEGIVKFGNTDVKQIMKPRMDIVAFDTETGFSELIVKIIDSGFSRVPVFEENLDKIKGVLYIKDLLPHLEKKNGFDWNSLIREAFYVPENKKIDDLLKEFKETKIHLAIVVDEYGGTQGLVTLEDVLEEIVGDITDEFDEEKIIYTKIDRSNYLFEGKTALIDVYRILDIASEKFEESKGESDTLAGFLLEISGKMPSKNDKIEFMDYVFTIESVDKRRIKSVKITLPENGNGEEKKSGNGILRNMLFVFVILFASCSGENVVPKPRGYMKTDYPEKKYAAVETFCPYHFEIPAYSELKDKPTKDDNCFKDLVFPYFNATLHFTYKPITHDTILAKYIDDSHNLAYDHTDKADDIQKTAVIDTVNDVYGIIYDIEGNAASQIQFFLTDSTHHFIRGALYFNHKPNYDSLIPAISYIREDIQHLIKTMRWQDFSKESLK
jgi:putative hemolysin